MVPGPGLKTSNKRFQASVFSYYIKTIYKGKLRRRHYFFLFRSNSDVKDQEKNNLVNKIPEDSKPIKYILCIFIVFIL